MDRKFLEALGFTRKEGAVAGIFVNKYSYLPFALLAHKILYALLYYKYQYG
jgi:hypothetical protein